jgi:UDP-N-acetylglucosamine 2-epimerase (non-hydrolysing)
VRLALAVGTRPEIVKMAPVIRAAAAAGVESTLIHTGQHYSWGLAGVFFEELELPAPDLSLDVGPGSHANHLARILDRLEPCLVSLRPDVVVVQGDTDSVLGVALTARALQIPVAHVEAGLRSSDRSMPEEMNRSLVDHLADICFAPTDHSRRTLVGEGVAAERIFVTGNTVVDEILRQLPRAEALGEPGLLGLEQGRYGVSTVHRAENTTDPQRLEGIFAGLERVGRTLGIPIVAPLHPRTVEALERAGIVVREPVHILPPLGYLRFLGLHAGAGITLTDSGGVQEEACALGIPCVTLRDSTERPESVDVGANMLAGWDPESILRAGVQMAGRRRTWLNPFGDGRSGERIVAALTGAQQDPLGQVVAGAHRNRRRPAPNHAPAAATRQPRAHH